VGGEVDESTAAVRGRATGSGVEVVGGLAVVTVPLSTAPREGELFVPVEFSWLAGSGHRPCAVDGSNNVQAIDANASTTQEITMSFAAM
jgi:hypothetical protein